MSEIDQVQNIIKHRGSNSLIPDFTPENLTAKRPGTGISPWYFWEWLGKKADRNYQKDEILE